MTSRTAPLILLSLCVVLASALALARAPSADLDALIDEILARPLFNASRTPRERDANDEPEKKVRPQLQARLTGIMIGPEAREALFEHAGDKPVALREGSEIDGWKVAAIRSAEVVLTSEFGEEVVKPADAGGATSLGRALNNRRISATQIKAAKVTRAPGVQPAQARQPAGAKTVQPQASSTQLRQNSR